MKILFVAPQPFFEPRGTPIAVKWALEVLGDAGNEIDLLTYHIGSDVQLKGLLIHRINGPKYIKSVPIGFSFSKLVCDFYLCFKLKKMVQQNKYDVIHAVEEAIFPAVLCRNIWQKKAKLV
jgi:hypothetical protein